MAERIYYFNVTEAEKLDLFLKSSLAKQDISFSRKKLKKDILSRRVRINNRVCQYASHNLNIKDRVSILINTEKIENNIDIKAQYELQDSEILYRDNFILVVNKPAGLPSQACLDPTRDHLYAAVQRYCQTKNISDYVGLHHRLDKDTSGVILFSINKSANKSIADSFKLRKAQKTYIAICDKKKTDQKIQPKWQIKNFLAKSKESTVNINIPSETGDLAITNFKLLCNNSSVAVIVAKPKTGRMHQIRSHLKTSGLPIYADPFYGKPRKKTRCHLHAYQLELQHPVTKKAISFSAPLAQDMQNLLETHNLKIQP